MPGPDKPEADCQATVTSRPGAAVPDACVLIRPVLPGTAWIYGLTGAPAGRSVQGKGKQSLGVALDHASLE